MGSRTFVKSTDHRFKPSHLQPAIPTRLASPVLSLSPPSSLRFNSLISQCPNIHHSSVTNQTPLFEIMDNLMHKNPPNSHPSWYQTVVDLNYVPERNVSSVFGLHLGVKQISGLFRKRWVPIPLAYQGTVASGRKVSYAPVVMNPFCKHSAETLVREPRQSFTGPWH